MPRVEDVFRLSGIPTYTFVEPVRYTELKVSIRTPGRCSVIEGPSGIGKTTSVTRVLDELGNAPQATQLSARRSSDIEYITALPEIPNLGTVVIDDFHRLHDAIKARIADFMKLLADEGTSESKLIIIGINKAGDHLVTFGSDLGLRIDVFRMESNPDRKIEELMTLGEQHLNITIENKEDFIARSQGSFQIAQMLCHHLCVGEGILETQRTHLHLTTSADVVVDRVMQELRRLFHRAALDFARGSKLRREGRAPYLHILRWLSEASEWSLDLREAVKVRPEHRGSVGQVVEKQHLSSLLADKHSVLGEYFHYEPETSILSVEDPRFVFYLKNIIWKTFAREVGYKSSVFRGAYDVALSFAGEDRGVAQKLFDLLSEREISVFYDMNEQHRILAANIEDYLAPIYRSEAMYVVPLLSVHFPKKIWTKFESDNFRERFGQSAVIPIRFREAQEGYFSDTANYGGLSFDSDGDMLTQLAVIAETIARRLAEDRDDGT